MEQILDVTLKNETYQHSDEQVDQFYSTFKDNQEVYRGMNEDVMDTLYGLVDFQKFKTSVLEYKKGCVDQDVDSAMAENREMIQSKQGYNYEEFLAEYNKNPDDKSTGWVRKLTMKDFKDGFKCQLWQKKNEIKGKPDWIRIDMVLQNISDPDWLPKYV